MTDAPAAPPSDSEKKKKNGCAGCFVILLLLLGIGSLVGKCSTTTPSPQDQKPSPQNQTEGILWKALSDGSPTYTADVPMGDTTVHTSTVFIVGGLDGTSKAFMTQGKALSIELVFLGSDPVFRVNGTSFKIIFSVSKEEVTDDGKKYEPMGHVIISGIFDPQKNAIQTIHYKEVFDSVGGMEYDMVRS